MKHYFIIHALGRTENDYWYKFVKRTVESKGAKCYVPTLPQIENMSYTLWAEAFKPYKKYINENSVFIGHSTGSIFIIKYLLNTHSAEGMKFWENTPKTWSFPFGNLLSKAI